MCGANSSPWRRASTVVRSARTWIPSCRATVTAGVAVSKARTSTPRRLRGRALDEAGDAGRPGCRRPAEQPAQVAGVDLQGALGDRPVDVGVDRRHLRRHPGGLEDLLELGWADLAVPDRATAEPADLGSQLRQRERGVPAELVRRPLVPTADQHSGRRLGEVGAGCGTDAARTGGP